MTDYKGYYKEQTTNKMIKEDIRVKSNTDKTQ